MPVQAAYRQGMSAIAAGGAHGLAVAQVGAVMTTYGYDQLNRLTSVSGPHGTTTYSYDPVGNRLTKATAGTTDYTYDAADEMTQAANTAYGYDANGNQTSRANDSFSYDPENRLTQSSIGGQTSSSVYNGDGLRVSHTAGGTTTNYTWDVVGGLPTVLQDGTNTYVYGLGLISATNASGNQTYFMHDGLGSTVALADGNGTITTTDEYDAFGAIRAQTGSPSNPFQFTGQQLDADSSLYFLRARYYDPTTGRFLGKDPAGASLNPYSYAGNNPVNRVDPSGLMATSGGVGPSSPVTEDFGGNSANYEGGKMPSYLDCADHTNPLSLACPTGLMQLATGGIMPLTPLERQALDTVVAIESGGDAAYAKDEGEGSGRSLIGTGESATRSEIVKKVKDSLTRLSSHVVRSMAKRGWTSDEIVEAVEEGEAFLAVDKTAGGASATRFVHPVTNKSVVVNDASGEIIHVGGTGFRY